MIEKDDHGRAAPGRRTAAASSPADEISFASLVAPLTSEEFFSDY